jgi:hypothetical protein
VSEKRVRGVKEIIKGLAGEGGRSPVVDEDSEPSNDDGDDDATSIVVDPSDDNDSLLGHQFSIRSVSSKKSLNTSVSASSRLIAGFNERGDEIVS